MKARRYEWALLTNLLVFVDFPKFHEEKARLVSNLAPGTRHGGESWGGSVDSLKRLKLSFAHLPSEVTMIRHDLRVKVALVKYMQGH